MAANHLFEPSWIVNQQVISSNVKDEIINLNVDLRDFHPNEITVHLKGRVLTVEAVQNRFDDQVGFLSHSILRRFFLSHPYNPRHLTATFVAGMLKLNSTRPDRMVQDSEEYAIPIQNLAVGGVRRPESPKIPPATHSLMMEGPGREMHSNCPACGPYNQTR